MFQALSSSPAGVLEEGISLMHTCPDDFVPSCLVVAGGRVQDGMDQCSEHIRKNLFRDAEAGMAHMFRVKLITGLEIKEFPSKSDNQRHVFLFFFFFFWWEVGACCCWVFLFNVICSLIVDCC